VRCPNVEEDMRGPLERERRRVPAIENRRTVAGGYDSNGLIRRSLTGQIHRIFERHAGVVRRCSGSVFILIGCTRAVMPGMDDDRIARLYTATARFIRINGGLRGVISP